MNKKSKDKISPNNNQAFKFKGTSQSEEVESLKSKYSKKRKRNPKRSKPRSLNNKKANWNSRLIKKFKNLRNPIIAPGREEGGDKYLISCKINNNRSRKKKNSLRQKTKFKRQSKNRIFQGLLPRQRLLFVMPSRRSEEDLKKY